MFKLFLTCCLVVCSGCAVVETPINAVESLLCDYEPDGINDLSDAEYDCWKADPGNCKLSTQGNDGCNVPSGNGESLFFKGDIVVMWCNKDMSKAEVDDAVEQQSLHPIDCATGEWIYK